jgi:DNA mismatch repair protein MutL
VSRIAILSELVQNRIAAGEVVERPASAVKELAENSLDAGATRIDIEIEQGGVRRIRVGDDGCGMARADLDLALERFATSKLRGEEDLAAISTLGFRGEALPSMASVAEMEILTRTRDSDSGYRLRSEPGAPRAGSEPFACSPGTIVELRDLFSRTPARLKFLKSESTETAAVVEVVQRLALARPDVAWRLRSGSREIVATPPGQSLRDRSAAVLGAAAAKDLLDVAAGEAGWLAIRGLVSAPGTQGRRDRRWQFVCLNGRPVRDRTIAHAAESAYESLMLTGRRPVYVLSLQIDLAQVDVNVHPAKYEVRFRSSSSVHEFVRRCIREALRSAGADIGPVATVRFGGGGGARMPAGHEPAHHDLWGSLGGGESVARESAAGTAYAGGGAGAADASLARASSAGGGREAAFSDARVVGVMRDGYVIVETPDDLRIVDPHAVHERLVYEALAAADRGGRVESQTLLVPETADLTPAELAVFERAKDALSELGFCAEAFGGSTVAVRAVPASISATDAADVLREVLDDIDEGGRGETVDLMERARKSVACRAAVKLGTRLAPSEIDWLLAESRRAPAACPHGRPFAWVLPRSEIAHRLGRA